MFSNPGSTPLHFRSGKSRKKQPLSHPMDIYGDSFIKLEASGLGRSTAYVRHKTPSKCGFAALTGSHEQGPVQDRSGVTRWTSRDVFSVCADDEFYSQSRDLAVKHYVKEFDMADPKDLREAANAIHGIRALPAVQRHKELEDPLQQAEEWARKEYGKVSERKSNTEPDLADKNRDNG